MSNNQAKLKNPSEDISKTPPCAPGAEKSVLSSMLQEPGKFIRLAQNESITPEDFYIVGHRLLYGFLLELKERGEEIELVSLMQHLLDNGLLDRIGGPAAVSDLYTYAPSNTHFTNHLDIVKSKAVLREIIRCSNAQIKAAYEAPDEVKELVEQCAANAEQVKTKTESRASNFKKYREQIVTSESMKDEARSYLNGDTLLGGDPFFLEGFEFACRKHESTIWVGTSFHGKSQCLQNQIAFLAANSRKSFLASFEQDPTITMGQILKTMTAYPDLAKSAEYDAAWEYINTMVSIYRSRKKPTAANIIETFRQAYLNEGTDTFVIDNFTTMAVDRGDNSAVAEACDRLRIFVAEYPIHLNIVTHPRKASNDAKSNPNKPPTQADIRGAAELGDLANNVMIVWRDMDKGRKIEEMKEIGVPAAEIMAFYNSTPCGFVALEKQRLGGEIPKKRTWFDKRVNQFIIAPGSSKPMFSTPPWEK